MARGNYAPQEVTEAEVVQVRTRDQYEGQRRAFNYVVRVNTIDADTGEPVLVNEYRSVASNSPLSTETVLNRITELLESGLG